MEASVSEIPSTHQPYVTIGVPVYNGAAQLEECLDCLQKQSFTDFKVFILDNASTDSTSDIAARFAAQDNRFCVICHEHNIGPERNFAAALACTDTPYFLWRAHDDLSARNYVEVLTRQLDRDPAKVLAVGDVTTTYNHRPAKSRPAPDIEDVDLGRKIEAWLLGSQASWVYGLWRTSAVRQIFDRVAGAYPYAWGSDHALLFPVLLDLTVTATHETVFEQRLFHSQMTHADPIKRPPVRDLVAMRSTFRTYVLEEIGRRSFPTEVDSYLRKNIERYISSRIYPRRRLIKRVVVDALKRTMGR